uniref:Ubiquitin-like domain-containing protein n=1 Tax=Xiphophorus couchianus TaxID=32473 RepID=A0A3B5KSE7_9TELE
MIYQVVVSGIDGQKTTIDLCDTEQEMKKITVDQLKEKIFQKLSWFSECAKKDLRLIFASKRLDDDTKRLFDYGITHKSYIQMVLSLDGGGEPEPGFTDDELGDKEGETRRSKECLMPDV